MLIFLFGIFYEYFYFLPKIFCLVFVQMEHGIPKFGNKPNTENFCSYEDHGMTPLLPSDSEVINDRGSL